LFGLGKSRSKLGKWLDARGISQTWLVKKSGVNKNTVSDLVSNNDPKHSPNVRTMKKIIKALQEIDPNVRSDKFWDI
jgi:predicted transcriptional regulator